MAKYARQISHPGFTEEMQQRLADSTVLIAGVGGLGGAVAWALAGAGIGKMILVHPGPLDLPDLNRQTLMTADWIDRPRVLKARERLNAYNPEIEIDTYDEGITDEIMQRLLPGCDLAIDARHNFPERRLVMKHALKCGIPGIEAAMSGLEGYIFNVFPDRGPCMECIFENDPPIWDPFGFSVFGAVASTIGSLAAWEAIKILSAFGKPLEGILLHYDFEMQRTSHYHVKTRKDCPVCHQIRKREHQVASR